jgi:hypothetical protein
MVGLLSSFAFNFNLRRYTQDHQKFLKQYEDFFVEWWVYYYDMIG